MYKNVVTPWIARTPMFTGFFESKCGSLKDLSPIPKNVPHGTFLKVQVPKKEPSYRQHHLHFFKPCPVYELLKLLKVITGVHFIRGSKGFHLSQCCMSFLSLKTKKARKIRLSTTLQLCLPLNLKNVPCGTFLKT